MLVVYRRGRMRVACNCLLLGYHQLLGAASISYVGNGELPGLKVAPDLSLGDVELGEEPSLGVLGFSSASPIPRLCVIHSHAS
jgi:hypothetical protein